MLSVGYSQTFHGVERGELLLVETGVTSVEADVLLVEASISCMKGVSLFVVAEVMLVEPEAQLGEN